MPRRNGDGRAGRETRLQVMLSAEELKALDDFRFQKRMPSRAAAVREILRRGLAAVGGFDRAPRSSRSNQFGVINDDTDSAVG